MNYPQRISIEKARKLCLKVGVVIHWRPEGTSLLPEEQQYALLLYQPEEQ